MPNVAERYGSLIIIKSTLMQERIQALLTVAPAMLVIDRTSSSPMRARFSAARWPQNVHALIEVGHVDVPPDPWIPSLRRSARAGGRREYHQATSTSPERRPAAPMGLSSADRESPGAKPIPFPGTTRSEARRKYRTAGLKKGQREQSAAGL